MHTHPQVGDETIRWEAGNALFFDDTYAHHVWNKTGADRVVLLFDLWHPDLAPEERDAVTDMFDQVMPHLHASSLACFPSFLTRGVHDVCVYIQVRANMQQQQQQPGPTQQNQKS